MQQNHVKRSLHAGSVQIGTWINTLGAPELPEIFAAAGFDYVQIDMEHSSFSIETVAQLCSAALRVDLVPIVRPPSSRDRHLISRPLDNGALGVLLPHVDTRAEAEEAVAAVKFPPTGRRGAQPPNIHTRYGVMDSFEYMKQSNQESLLMVQIESEEAIADLDAILSVPEVDGATIGRGDLAAELGIKDRDDPRIRAGVEATIDACYRHNKIPGLLVQSVAEARDWISRGVRYVTYAGETAILRRAAEAAVKEIRATTPS